MVFQPQFSMSSPTQQIGTQAERQAEEYLYKQNLTLVKRNYRCRFGEIDLIMQDKQTLVFVEVRYRDKTVHGNAAETVQFSKRKKLIKAATFYLVQQKLWEKVACRFDVIAISPLPPTEIDWIKDAFSVE